MDSLEKLVRKWKSRACPDVPDSIRETLNAMYATEFVYLVRRVKEEGKCTKKDAKTLDAVFELAWKGTRLGFPGGVSTDFITCARDLADAGIYCSSAITFLREIVARCAVSPVEGMHHNLAVEVLLSGISSSNTQVAQHCIYAVGSQFGRFNWGERKRIIGLLDKTGPDIKESFPADALRQEYGLTNALEYVLTGQKGWKAKSPWQVISVHSSVGGVGKTTLAIALAQQLVERDKQVCVVDCNDEGPSLQTYFPTDTASRKTKWFFSEWFCKDGTDVPDGLLHGVPGYDGRLTIVPGSMHYTDIDRLDATQRGVHPPLGNYDHFRERLVMLARHLIRKKGFDSVIFDTNPGLAHLSHEVLLATATIDASRVYVARPRPADIALLCLEDSVLFEPGLVANSAIALNFYDADAGEGPTTDYIAKALSEFPYFRQYSHKMDCPTDASIMKPYIRSRIAERLVAIVKGAYGCPCQSRESLHIPSCPFIPELNNAGNLRVGGTRQEYISEVVRKSKMQSLASEILDRLKVPR